MPKHGSMLLYVHRNHKAHQDGDPRTSTSTLTDTAPEHVGQNDLPPQIPISSGERITQRCSGRLSAAAAMDLQAPLALFRHSTLGAERGKLTRQMVNQFLFSRGASRALWLSSLGGGSSLLAQFPLGVGVEVCFLSVAVMFAPLGGRC